MKMKDVIYVPSFTKNLFSILFLEEGDLCKLKCHSYVALNHSTKTPCELWHIRLDHINYKALPYVSKVVTGLPELNFDHEGVRKGCAQG
jgi:hypothetical protein